jgi:SAM-dependent methyltransferase
MASPLAVYADMLERPYERSLARAADGSAWRPRVERWTATADAVDERAVAGLAGPVLDVGCGPGRHLCALARQGVVAVGIDVSPMAVGLARLAGAHAIVGSIFEEVPGSGRWGGALLLDGNIGIGGRPERLLRRVADLLAPGGRIVVELGAPSRATVRTRVRLETVRAASDWFDWAEVSAADADRLLGDAGLVVARRWHERDRWFVVAAAGGAGEEGDRDHTNRAGAADNLRDSL